MSTTPIDAAALAQARERLEAELQRFKDCYRFDPEAADVRLVLDALKEAERKRRETIAAFKDYRYSHGCSCCANVDVRDASEARLAAALGCPPYDDNSGWNWTAHAALAAKEQA